MKTSSLLFTAFIATILFLSVSLQAQTTLFSQNFETSQTIIPAGWNQQRIDSTPSNPGWGFNNKFPYDSVGNQIPAHTYYTFVDGNTNPNNKVAYYAFDATPVAQGKLPLTTFTDKANVIVMFEGTAWEVADSSHYGSAGSYILTVNPNYHYYKQIKADMKAMQARGVKVLWNVDDAASWNTATPFTTYNGTPLTANQYAAFVKANVIDSLGLDGIALDVEHLFSTAANANYIALLKALGAYFGPKSSNPAYTIYTAAIYNGAQAGYAIGQSTTVAAYFNYVEDMGYWQNNTTRFNNWGNTIGHSKVMDGVSNQMNTLTNAMTYAAWQPTGTPKAGVMVFAANVAKGYTDSIFAAEAPANQNVLVANYDTLYTSSFSCAGQTNMAVSFDLLFWKKNGHETANLLVSTDGGITWSVVTGSGLPDNGKVWQDGLVYDISTYAANQANVKLAFTYYDGCPNTAAQSAAGLAIDNVKVYTVPASAGINEITTAAVFEMEPNPAKEHTTIVFDLARQQNVKLEVFNLLGEKVYSAYLGKTTAGHHTFSVNTAALPSGIYLVNFVTDTTSATRKLIIQ